MIIELRNTSIWVFGIYNENGRWVGDLCSKGVRKSGITAGKYKLAAKNPKKKGWIKVTSRRLCWIKVGPVLLGDQWFDCDVAEMLQFQVMGIEPNHGTLIEFYFKKID